MRQQIAPGLVVLCLIAAAIAPPAAVPRAQAQLLAPEITSLAAIVFPDAKGGPAAFGVYLGHGLVLTNWHPWTLDGRFYTGDDPALAPSRQVPRYDDDHSDDPGEAILNMADCAGVWTPLDQAGPDCTPYAQIARAGVTFPLAKDASNTTPIPVQKLVYASRRYDIALFQVDAITVEARGVRSARLSMIPTGADYPVIVATSLPDRAAATYPAALLTGEPVLLPQSDVLRYSGPWRVPSLALNTSDPLPNGGPVFDAATGDLVGLTWRASDDETQPQTWVSPAAAWFHDLYGANDDIRSPALAAVLNEASTAPVDGPPTLNDPLTPGLGNGGIDVQHYTLKLDIDVVNKTLAGVATLDIRATLHRLFTFSLDARGLEIDSVTINGLDAPFVAKDEKLIIQLPVALDYGTPFQAAISYHAAPQPFRSPYMPYFDIGMTFVDGQAYTLNEPDAAHTWFPCNDHPSDRAAYDFYLRVADPLDAVANGQLVETIPNDDGTRVFHWQMNDPMATYLVVVAIADYAPVENLVSGDIAITNYVYADKTDAGRRVFSYTDDALALLEGMFGPYPFDSYGQVVVPQQSMALETQTMTIMPDGLLDLTEEDIFALLVHELAHQWYGDSVTPATWADIWLNEGFATYAEWLAQEARYGPDAALAARSYAEQTLLTDSRVTALVAPAPEDTFGVASYKKGAWVLHLLREQIGDEAFFTLLKAYAQTFRDRPATSLDFWRLAEEISGQDLHGFFDQWLLQGGMPRYTLYWSETGTGVDVLLCSNAPGSYRLDLPLLFRSAGKEGMKTLEVPGAEARASFALEFVPAEVEIDPEQTVLAQVQAQSIAELPEACPAGES